MLSILTYDLAYFEPHAKDNLIPSRLDRRQICPDHHGFRVLIGHFNRPDTGPCPEIQDLLGILQRGQMQMSAAQEQEDMMFDVDPIQFCLTTSFR